MAAPDRPSTAARPPGPGGAPSPSPSGSAVRESPSPSGSAERERQSPSGSAERERQSLPELGRELLDLTVTYAKQETVDPLKSLGRRVGLGVLGSALASVGLIFLLVGVLRLVQVELELRGLWSWVPYLAAIVVAGVVAGLSFKQIGGGRGR